MIGFGRVRFIVGGGGEKPKNDLRKNETITFSSLRSTAAISDCVSADGFITPVGVAKPRDYIGIRNTKTSNKIPPSVLVVPVSPLLLRQLFLLLFSPLGRVFGGGGGTARRSAVVAYDSKTGDRSGVSINYGPRYVACHLHRWKTYDADRTKRYR